MAGRVRMLTAALSLRKLLVKPREDKIEQEPPGRTFQALNSMWFAVDTEIYPLKTDSEWKRALEKSLIDAAKFPLPMEVFKVRCWFLKQFICSFWE